METILTTITIMIIIIIMTTMVMILASLNVFHIQNQIFYHFTILLYQIQLFSLILL